MFLPTELHHVKCSVVNDLHSLRAIAQVREKNLHSLKAAVWLRHLVLTTEKRANTERLNAIADLDNHFVLQYVERTLQILSCLSLTKRQVFLLEETLKWSEVAKCGMPHQRKIWLLKGFNLFVHNEGSAAIYQSESDEADTSTKLIVATLITTHGLVGQIIRGEVPFVRLAPLRQLVDGGHITESDLRILLIALDTCVVGAVDIKLWEQIQPEAEQIVDRMICGDLSRFYPVQEQLMRLRTRARAQGENSVLELKRYMYPRLIESLTNLFDQVDLWYVEAALHDFSFEEFLKILLICASGTKQTTQHLSFELLMQSITYDHDGKKTVNLYKKRILEKYLSDLTFSDIHEGKVPENLHVRHVLVPHASLNNTLFFDFQFSKAGSRLIDFCVEAERSDARYEQAIILLYDLFGLRRDAYDRFYNEENYLKTMNSSIDYKTILLDYITGKHIVDIGPGGGALMDIIVDRLPDAFVIGVDFSQNVIDTLQKKKQLEGRRWDVRYGNAMALEQTFTHGEVDTVIYCSIWHELYSYIETEGRKFNTDTLKSVLQSTFDILPIGGRILIRDGIMTEPKDQMRRIRFIAEDGLRFLERYAADFKGRTIEYELVARNEVRMPVNDAMEFLYTYTWGEDSYVHEVNEQFGYFTPSEFAAFVQDTLGSNVKIIELQHFLQDGYTTALSPKVAFTDDDGNPVSLPDSTCIVVLEKLV